MILPSTYSTLPSAYLPLNPTPRLPPSASSSTAYCLLPSAYFLPHTAYCHLPTFFRILPTAYCLLPHWRRLIGKFLLKTFPVSDSKAIIYVVG